MTFDLYGHLMPTDNVSALQSVARLFPDVPRTDPDFARANESDYGFLQRVDDPAFSQVRAILNEWFERFADWQDTVAVRDLRNRFHAKPSDQFNGAFWELYLHEVFARLGFQIEVHPDSERGTRPDFALSRDGQCLYLEAAMLIPGFSGHKEPRNVQAVIEYVNEAFDPKWRFRLRYVTPGQRSPRKIAVKDVVLNWLHTLDWDENWQAKQAGHPSPEAEIAVDDWVIALAALPLAPENHDPEPRQMIWLYRSIAGFPGALGATVRPKLAEKASKYGDLGAPLVVAMWVIDAMASDDTAPLALFGTGFSLDDGVQQTGLPFRTEPPVGLWTPEVKNKNRASAVLATDGMRFNYCTVSRVLPHLWLNPWSDRPLEVDLPFASSRVSGDKATVENRSASTSAAELFGLPEDWPGELFQQRRKRAGGTPTGTRDADSA